MKIDRTSPSDAREMLASILPEPEHQLAVARLFADAIRTAHAYGDRIWSFTLASNRIQLNVGSLLLLSVRKTRHSWILLDPRAISAASQGLFNRTKRPSEGPPARFPELMFRHIQPRVVAEHATELREPLLAAVRVIGERSNRTSYGRSWSPGVVGMLEELLNVELPRAAHGSKTSLTSIADDSPDLEALLETFFSEHVATDVGRRHLEQFVAARRQGRANWEAVKKAMERGEEPIDSVFDGLIPYFDTAKNRAHPARWIHPAPAARSSAKAWFEGTPGAPREVARAIVELVRRVEADPTSLAGACHAFGALKATKHLQSGRISPILASVVPEQCCIVNPTMRRVFPALFDAPLRTTLDDYPASVEAAREAAEMLKPAAEDAQLPEGVTLDDLLVSFCQWHAAFASIDGADDGIEFWKIAPGENANLWTECRDGGYICVGWPELGDLSPLSDDDPDELCQRFPELSRGTLMQLAHFPQIPIGSRIIANRGTREIVGIGEVVGEYEYAPNEHPSMPNRLPVRWTDTAVHRVTQPGWRRTLVRLNAEKFAALTGPPVEPSPSSLPPFTKRAFQLLQLLREAPHKDTIERLNTDLRAHVQDPLRALIESEAPRLPEPLPDILETRKNLLSRFHKNDFGAGGAHDYLWAAFYPRGDSRRNAPQLYVTVLAGGIDIGFCAAFADHGEDRKLARLFSERADVLEPYIADALSGLSLLFGFRDPELGDARQIAADGPETLADWLGAPRTGIAARHFIPADDVVVMAPTELAERVHRAFAAFAPLMAIAVLPNPAPALAALGVIDEDVEAPSDRSPFTRADALADLFMSGEELDELVRLVQRKRNVILQGPPGTGKTFAAKRLARLLVGHTDPDHVEMVQFHPSYSYEDFVQGFRPAPAGGFALQDGIFHRFCRAASERPKETFVLVIDEINRGNLGRILGELMVLIEADKRGPEHRMRLAYARPKDDPFFVPDNIYILGLMNTADRSLAVVDYALRRRFAFWTLNPAFQADQFGAALRKATLELAWIDELRRRMRAVNDRIRKEKLLGPGFEIGHSFFCPTAGEVIVDPEAWLGSILKYEIGPLLREYCFDRPSLADDLLNELAGSA